MPRAGRRLGDRLACAPACLRRRRRRFATYAARLPHARGAGVPFARSADFAFAMQGLGSGAISLFGSDAHARRYLPARRARGKRIAAFALSEREAQAPTSPPCDARRAATATARFSTARRRGSPTAASPTSTSCSRGPVRRRQREGIAAFVVDADAPGFEVAERIETIAPHPLGDDPAAPLPRAGGPRHCVAGRRLRARDGARSTSSAQRRRAPRSASRAARYADAVAHAERAADVRPNARRLPTHAGRGRRHGHRDRRGGAADVPRRVDARPRGTGDGRGRDGEDDGDRDCAARHRPRRATLRRARRRRRGNVVERLYREIRALRIYEGATEIQQLIVARAVLGRDAGRAPQRG